MDFQEWDGHLQCSTQFHGGGIWYHSDPEVWPIEQELQEATLLRIAGTWWEEFTISLNI